MILAKTVKGYGLGETAEGRNTAHQTKKFAEAEMMKIRDRFNVPISDDMVEHLGLPPSSGRFAGNAVSPEALGSHGRTSACSQA